MNKRFLETRLKADGFRGPVFKVKEKKYFADEKQKLVLDTHQDTEYNKAEHKVNRIIYNNDDSIRLVQTTLFDEKGNGIGFVNYDGSGNKKNEAKWVLDNKGNPIKKYYDDELDEVFEYKYDEKLIVSKSTFSPVVSYEKFDKNGYLEALFNVAKGMTPIDGIPVNTKSKAKNDANGNMLEFHTYDADANEFCLFDKYEYNENNDVVNEWHYKVKNGRLVELINSCCYEYEYDDYGNWTKKSICNMEKIPSIVLNRSIQYF